MGIVESLAFHPPDKQKTQEIFNQRAVKKFEKYTKTERGNKICMLWFNFGHEFTILYSHGNAEDIGLSYRALKKLVDKVGVNLLAYDYSGYGLSEGKHSEKDAYADIRAAYNFLLSEGVPKNKVIFFGRSLGSGPTTDLAKDTPEAAGLVLQSPLASAIRCVMGNSAAVFDFMDIFKNRIKISKVKTYPVLIIHGKKDQVVPFDHGEELYNNLVKAGNPEVDHLWLQKCGHNDIEFLAEQAFYDKLRDFVERIRRYQASQASKNHNISELMEKVPA